MVDRDCFNCSVREIYTIHAEHIHSSWLLILDFSCFIWMAEFWGCNDYIFSTKVQKLKLSKQVLIYGINPPINTWATTYRWTQIHKYGHICILAVIWLEIINSIYIGWFPVMAPAFKHYWHFVKRLKLKPFRNKPVLTCVL